MATDPLLEGLLIFAVVAALQLPGKSNFAVISLSTRYPHRAVFVGASVGLAAATVVSVAIGYGAETILGPYLEWVKIAGGSVLLAFGVRELLWGPADAVRAATTSGPAAPSLARVRVLALGLTFLLEMGDNTQVLAILFVASTHDVVLVYLAATAALITIAALSSAGARYLMRRIPEPRLRLILGALLMIVGTLTIVLTLVPGVLPVAT